MPQAIRNIGEILSSGYRYSFNGKEKIDEVEGSGNSIDFGARIYDCRVGRFLSTDPKQFIYTWQSTYAFAANNPIKLIDVNGEGPGDPVPGELENTAESDAKYTKSFDYEPGMIYVLAPDGELHGFKSEGFDYTYSDGGIHDSQQKAEGVWNVINSDGHFLWDNTKGEFVKNTSNVGPGNNTFGGIEMGTTYAGANNPSNYSQPPQNLADAAGLKHDQLYDKDNISGSDGVWSDKSTNTNLILIEDCIKIQEMYFSGAIDPYTGVPVSYQTFKTAVAMEMFFQAVEDAKQVRTEALELKEELTPITPFDDEEYMNEEGWRRLFGGY